MRQSIPAGWWLAAQSLGAYTLVGCTVAPGFDFADLELVDASTDAAKWFRSVAPAQLVDGPEPGAPCPCPPTGLVAEEVAGSASYQRPGTIDQ